MQPERPERKCEQTTRARQRRAVNRTQDSDLLAKIESEANDIFPVDDPWNAKRESIWDESQLSTTKQLAETKAMTVDQLKNFVKTHGDSLFEEQARSFLKTCQPVSEQYYFLNRKEALIQGRFGEAEVRSTGRYAPTSEPDMKQFFFCLDIMKVGAAFRHVGWFTRFFNLIVAEAPHEILYVECIHDRSLWCFLRRRGAFSLPFGDPQSLYLHL